VQGVIGMDEKNYLIYDRQSFTGLKDFLKERMASRNSHESICKEYTIWSARLGTGLFGLTSCYSGNRGPKSPSEVLLAVGDEGLVKLINFGFITCPVCKPEKTEKFWSIAGPAVEKKYGKEYDIHNLENFVNKNILTFDARRVDWEEIVPRTGAFPGRIYLPQGLNADEVSNFEKRLKSLHKQLPEIGYLDKNAQPWRFVTYDILH
jgi:hypothetical protein